MDNQQESQEKFEGCGSKWHCHRRGRPFKFLVLVLVILFIFVLGYGLGKVKMAIKYGVFGSGTYLGSEWGMMGSNYFGNSMMSRGEWGMMSNWLGKDQKGAVKVFGTISKIDGNKITVLDNGGKEKIVLSVSETRIFSSSAEIGLAALKAGWSVSAVGSLDKDGQLQAKYISITGL